ncbi:MAG: glycoside hydrolase family 92 protein [Tannerella sp.]|jgi:predicted alpha-1,2-mannosidase|nr:glycoside hydrolase family 92 protein [Tannerella sp.]
MKMKKYADILFILLFLPAGLAAQQSAADYVDPTIGGVGVILEPTRPTVHLPNQMIRVFPLRRDRLDDRIANFPLTSASHRLYSVFAFLPIDGTVSPDSWSRQLEYDHEVTAPYYYSAQLGETGCQLEFSPAKKSGFFRIRFSGKEEHHLRTGVLNGKGTVEMRGKRQLCGEESFSGMKAYFYAETDVDVIRVRYRSPEDRSAVMLCVGQGEQTVSFRYGVSYISVEQARENLLREIPDRDFEAVKTAARNAWEEALSLIRVEGGTVAQKKVFYTALYRCFERMVDINEYGRYYSGYDHQVHVSEKPFLVDNWLWDTYIALEPLHVILHPEQAVERINSYIDMYRQGGYIPSFALVSGDWPAMTGNYAAVWMADAWFKGLRGFDLKTACEGLKKNSLDATLLPWRNGRRTSLDDFYNTHGYMPGLPPGERETVAEVDTVWEKRQSVSVTTANSYSDWCIAQLASELNLQDDRTLFLKRAENYRHVYRADKGFMWPKDRDGQWIEPFDPRFAGREYFTENNAYTFNWDVKHDLNGLFELMGGRAGAEEKLDQLFREDLGLPKFRFWLVQPDASGLTGQFVMGNEPGFHIPYIYNYLGAPWKTQKRIRMLLDAFFTDNLFGIPGDEDGGGMSAFVVFSMMGFFPVTPGIPAYAIGSPVFEKITVRLPGGKEFVVSARNSSASCKYIRSAQLNGKPLERAWFTHGDLTRGGRLELIMSDRPDKQWGSRPEDAPPSALHFRNNE